MIHFLAPSCTRWPECENRKSCADITAAAWPAWLSSAPYPDQKSLKNLLCSLFRLSIDVFKCANNFRIYQKQTWRDSYNVTIWCTFKGAVLRQKNVIDVYFLGHWSSWGRLTTRLFMLSMSALPLRPCRWEKNNVHFFSTKKIPKMVYNRCARCNLANFDTLDNFENFCYSKCLKKINF